MLFFSLGVSMYRNFHGYHEISWVNIKFVDAMKPRGIHGISMDPTDFHGNFRGKFVENFMDPTNAPRNPWNP